MARLPEIDRHVPVGDATLKTDVQDAVAHRFTALVDELKPQVQRAAEAGGALTLHKRVSSINAGYEQAQLAAAANRAAVTAFQGLPVKHAMSPGAVADAAVVTEPGEDLLENLVLRMTNGAAGAGEQDGPKPPQQTGKDKGRFGERGYGVASTRTRRGPPRVGRGSAAPRGPHRRKVGALHLLKTKDTFTAWVESKQLQGAQLREALSIARALDLATHWYGAEYLVTDSAEVQLRRLLSVALAAKLGNHKLSQFLEEVPGDSALAELPDDVLRSLSERLKLEMKLEQLTAAKQ